MANPVTEGTLPTRPFVSQYVDITHEDLYITLDSNFEQAEIVAVYHIKASKEGLQTPFLFYASEFLDAFTVHLDGQEIEDNGIPNDGFSEGASYEDFDHLFSHNTSDYRNEVLLEVGPHHGFYIRQEDMLFFNADIPKGRHTIKVTYKATKWTDGWEKVNTYSFRYALSPAKYWKSFGTLDIHLDARACRYELSTNIPESPKGDINQQMIWHLDSLPTDVLQIIYEPEIDPKAQFLMDAGPTNLAWLTFLILAALHSVIIYLYRKKYPGTKYSLVVILGSIVISWLFLYSGYKYNTLIYEYLGNHAGQRGYDFFVFLAYPIVLLVYWPLMWGIDKFLVRRIRKNLTADNQS
jgi:hypothetical protein